MRFLLREQDYSNKDTNLIEAPDPLIVGCADKIYETVERVFKHSPNIS